MNNLSGSSIEKIAHELAQPLTTIQAFGFVASENLRSETIDTEALANCIGKMNEAAEFATKLLAQLQQAQASPIETNFDQMDLSAVVAKALGLLENEIRESGVEIQLSEFPAERGSLDNTQLQSVLVNLIRNGIESCVEKNCQRPMLGIFARETNGDVEIVVSDNGCGVPDDKKPNLFRATSSNKLLGMGIGLAICKETIEAAGGQIWHEDNSPAGANFHIKLPTQQTCDPHQTGEIRSLCDAPSLNQFPEQVSN